MSEGGITKFSGQQRMQDGLTVFCSDGTGRTRALVRHEMPLREALREICLQLDAWPGEWRIDCISTPTTIYRDLQGSRVQRSLGGRRRADGQPGQHHGEPPEYTEPPERQLLGVIGRRDLLVSPHP